MDPRLDPVRVVDGSVVALCRPCAGERARERDEDARAKCRLCESAIDLLTARTVVTGSVVELLCGDCAALSAEERARIVAARAPRPPAPIPIDSVNLRAGRWRAPIAIAVAAAAAVACVQLTTGTEVTRVATLGAGDDAHDHATDHDDAAAPPENPRPIAWTPADEETVDAIEVVIEDVNRGRARRFRIPREGSLDIDLQNDIAELLACRRTGRAHRMDPALIRLLADVADQFEGHTIQVVSAYRAGEEESETSPHLAARAVDFRVAGIGLTTVRTYVWHNHDDIGLGYYPQSGFLHVDTRPGERIAWTQPTSGAEYVYHPGWARAGDPEGDSGDVIAVGSSSSGEVGPTARLPGDGIVRTLAE